MVQLAHEALVPRTPAPLDLQAILHRLYDSYGFKKYMYQSSPNPPLTPEDAAWARGVLAGVGVTV
jgi:hypothetical protein